MLTSAVLSLVPFIITSTAYVLFRKDVGQAMGVTPTTLEIVSGLATASYAFGALMGGDIINRFPQRILFLTFESLFIAGAVLAATSRNIAFFAFGNVVQGLTTGFLLVVALPPVIRRFPATKMPITSAVVNMGLFGAITAGPLLGGVVAALHVWRWYYAALALIGAAIVLLAAVSLPDMEPQNRDMPFDWHALLFGLGATFLPFYAAGALAGNSFSSFRFTVPLGLGLASFVALILTQYHKQQPLAPVKRMWNTFPVIGTVVAMAAGGVFVALLDLGLRFVSEVQHQSPLSTGLNFWPLLPGIVISAVLLGLLIRTRFLPLLVLGGMFSLIFSGLLLANLKLPHANLSMGVAAGLLGFGAGATVSPALWLASFSLQSKMVGRIFALVELVRSVADFILAPVILEVAHIASRNPSATAHGIGEAAWYATLVTIGATALCIALYFAGNAGLPAPDLNAWLDKNQLALPSKKLAAALREGKQQDALRF
jgi:MFS family permease